MNYLPFESGERLVQATDEHWVKYVIPAVVATLLLGIALLLFILAGVGAHHYMWLSHATFVTALLLFFFTHHWFFMILLSESLDKIIVTNRRLLRVRYNLFFTEDILEVSIERTKTVDARKTGFLQNLLHYGSLAFETKLAIVPLVPHPNRLARAIREAMAAK